MFLRHCAAIVNIFFSGINSWVIFLNLPLAISAKTIIRLSPLLINRSNRNTFKHFLTNTSCPDFEGVDGSDNRWPAKFLLDKPRCWLSPYQQKLLHGTCLRETPTRYETRGSIKYNIWKHPQINLTIHHVNCIKKTI